MRIRNTLALTLAGLWLAACGSSAPEVIVVTATPLPATATPIPSTTPLPTHTPRPAPTEPPTPAPVPTIAPVAIGEVEAALRKDGYRRFPFTSGDGLNGFTWIKDSTYEQVTTWEDGAIELEVLHDQPPAARAEHMERKFEVLDAVFPAEFMMALREEHSRYNEEVGPNVSGEPADVFSYGDEWQTVWGEYNVSAREIQGYEVRFSLWWWQSTCPPQYDYCYYDDFPGLEFTGDSSFVFHTILLWPLLAPRPPDSTA